MLHAFMDFSPSDISDVDRSEGRGKTFQASTSQVHKADFKETIDLHDKKLSDDYLEQEMGKTRSSGLQKTNKDIAIAKPSESRWISVTTVSDTKSDNSLLYSEGKSNMIINNHKTEGSNVFLNTVEINNISKTGFESQNPTQLTDCEEFKVRLIQDEKHSSLLNGSSKDSVHYNCMKLQNQEFSKRYLCEALFLDHPYSISSDHLHLPPYEDDDVDIDSDICQLSQETGGNLHFALNEGLSDINRKLSSFSDLSTPSSHSSLNAMIFSKGSSYSGSGGDEKMCVFKRTDASEKASSDTISACYEKTVQSQSRTDTFSSLNLKKLELEKFLEFSDSINSKQFNTGIPAGSDIPSFSLSSPSVIYPLLQSPSLDWDRSDARSEVPDDSSDGRTPLRMSPDFISKAADWSHPVFHDHDYCTKDTDSSSSADDVGNFKVLDDLAKCKSGKRKYIKKSKLLEEVNCERIMKAKYLKKELLRNNGFMKSSSVDDLSRKRDSFERTSLVGRPRKRQLDKITDDEIDPETGSKLKITGKFQDQYVYYLSKSLRTRSRGRLSSSSLLTSDKLNTAVPNPGDIVVPHLTDADIETVRLKGRDALNLSDRPNVSHLPYIQSVNQFISQPGESIPDVDSHIVSTILSMENDSLDPSETTCGLDIINTADLNPDQPALTESLRLMSGDPSITSEHVLNYLLSVMKDERSFTNGDEFDMDDCLFSSLSSDFIRSDHMEGPENVISDSVSSLNNIHCNSSNLTLQNSTIPVQSSALVHELDKCVHSSNEYNGDERISLLDEFSSFMSESNATLPSNLQEGESHSLVTHFLKSGHCPSLEPQTSSSLLRLTSIEKTLDYLGANDADLKLENSDYDIKNDQMISSHPVTSVVDDTPWIVTITLYFNDVPAIMINNQPYIRLVDIHKQILPAKDTGILKKRCQLLSIPVLTCTEMQRYFLVKYGRAYNSKSALIVSKDHAKDLIVYYATPQPRAGRVSETHHFGRFDRSARPQNVGLSLMSSGSRKQRKAESIRMSTSKTLKRTTLSKKDTLQKSDVMASSTDKHTRHKKINYLKLLKGEKKVKSPKAAVLEIGATMMKPTPSRAHDKSVKAPLKKKLKRTLSANNKCESVTRKYLPTHQKQNSQVESSHVKKVKLRKLKKRSKGRIEQVADICLELHSNNTHDLSLKEQLKSLSNERGFLSNGSSMTTTDSFLRVLPVAHQAETTTDLDVPSQHGYLHIDLFIKSNSACICCAKCGHFMSVPHFMQHHHPPADSESLTLEGPRILVPRNIETISQLEQELWMEFHSLQEAIGGFGDVDDEADNDDDGNTDKLCSLHASDNRHGHTSPVLPQLSSSLQLGVEKASSYVEGCIKEQSSSALFSGCPVSSPVMDVDRSCNSGELPRKSLHVSNLSQNEKRTFSSEPLVSPGLMWSDADRNNASHVKFTDMTEPDTTHIRTSSRIRKSKQFFSIENYHNPQAVGYS